MHFDVELGKKQLSKVEQPNVDIPAGSKRQYKTNTYLAQDRPLHDLFYEFG
jgi:hypothetical protein